MKKIVLIVVAILALLIVLALLLPPFINLANYKAQYLPLVEEALQRKVDVGDVRLRIVPSPAIRVYGLQISDNPAFSNDPFLTAQEVSLRLKFWPLLGGQFLVNEFIVEKPVVRLLKQTDGTFNFADIGKKKGAREKKPDKETGKDGKSTKLAEIIPAQVRIEQGDITLQTKGQKPFRVEGIDLLIKDFSTAAPFPYRIALKPPGVKAIALEGALQYDEPRTALHLRDNHLKIQDIDLAVNGSVTDLTAVPRVSLSFVNGNFDIKPVIQTLAESGTISKELEISGPVGLNVTLAGPSNALTAKANAELKGLKVNDKRALHGNVTGNTTLTLPLGGQAPLVRALSGNGQLTAKDGALTNVDLVSKVQSITGLIGLPEDQRAGATTFKILQIDFTTGGGVLEFKRLFLDGPVMEAVGNGKMALETASLDISLDVALSPEASARAGSGKATTFFKDERGRTVVPLKITGPVKSPSVKPDTEKLIRKGFGKFFEQKKGGIFDRFFNRK